MNSIDRIKLPKAGLPATTYARFLMDIRAQVDFWDRGKGYLSWVQGRVLVMARQVCKRGTWNPFLATLRIKPATAHLCMAVAERFTETQAREMGYTEMLQQVYPSFRRSLNEAVEAADVVDQGANGRTSTKATISSPHIVQEEEACTVSAISKKLEVWATRLEEFRDDLPKRIPATAHLQNLREAISQVRQARNMLAGIEERLSKWEANLRGQVA